jgi:hypothetical protein
MPAVAVGLLLACGGATERGPILELDRGQEKDLADEAGPGFAIKRTSHFIVAYNTQPRVMDELTTRLEQTYFMVYQFCEMNGIKAHRPQRRLEVLFFDKRAGYDRYAAHLGIAAAGTFGLYHTPTNRSFFFNAANDPEIVKLGAMIADASENMRNMSKTLDDIPNDQTRFEVRFSDGRRFVGTKAEIGRQVSKEIEKSKAELGRLESRRKTYCEQINQTVIQHETAHQTLFNAGVHVRGASNPRWLVEGLACLFETPPGPPGSGFAVLNASRLHDFRVAVAGGETQKQITSRDYLRAVVDGRILSPSQLILKPGLLDARGDEGTRAYALAWALCHYLQRNQREQLAGYLAVVGSRHPGDHPRPEEELALFEEHFGPIDEVFLRKFSAFILGLTARAPIRL